MEGRPFRILFLSQRNSARSVMAEAIANSIGHGRIEAFSAGVRPAPNADPVALELLEHAGIPAPDHPPLWAEGHTAAPNRANSKHSAQTPGPLPPRTCRCSSNARRPNV